MQRTSRISLAVVAAMAGFVLVPALAQESAPADAPPPAMGPQMDFKAVDTNGDGKVTPEEMQAWRAAQLKEIDTNGDGVLDRDEVRVHILKRMEARADEMAGRMMEKRDSNGDGKVTLDEAAMPADRADRMFKRVDTNGDGAIDQAEADAFKTRMAERMAEHGRHDGKGHGKHKHGDKGGDKGGDMGGAMDGAMDEPAN